MLLATKIIEANKTAGAKPDVIFIHGTGSNSDMWSFQAKSLSDLGYRCILVDLRGHGGTPEQFEPTSVETHLDDVIATLEHEAVSFPAIFVGHSLGAIISIELAERRPEMFKQIFAAGMPGRVFSFVVTMFRLVMLLPYEKLRGTALHRNLDWRTHTLIKTDRFTLMQIVENFQGLDYVSKQFNISCPVHFSVGRFDPVAPCIFVQKMHRQLPQSTLQIFEFAGHNFMDQYRPQFDEWLTSSLLHAK